MQNRDSRLTHYLRGNLPKWQPCVTNPSASVIQQLFHCLSLLYRANSYAASIRIRTSSCYRIIPSTKTVLQRDYKIQSIRNTRPNLGVFVLSGFYLFNKERLRKAAHSWRDNFFHMAFLIRTLMRYCCLSCLPPFEAIGSAKKAKSRGINTAKGFQVELRHARKSFGFSSSKVSFAVTSDTTRNVQHSSLTAFSA